MNKGKQGEGQLATTLGVIQQAEECLEFIKPTYTNTPDDGLDFELYASHNIAEKFNAISDNANIIPKSSHTKIKIRIDHKNIDGKISKPIADKFVKDCEKHPNEAEHWLTGGNGLTSGAKKSLEESDYVCRYYSQDNLNKIKFYYEAQLMANIKYSLEETISSGYDNKLLIHKEKFN